MGDLQTVLTQYAELSKEWNKGSGRSAPKVGGGCLVHWVPMYSCLVTLPTDKKIFAEQVAALLTKLKYSLTQLSFLPTRSQAARTEELVVSRDTLEIGAQYAVSVGDIPMFERYMAQLQTYYHDFSAKLPESVYK